MPTIEHRFATPQDAALLARMNEQLIRDEGHRSAINLMHLERRMNQWLSGEYQAVIFSLKGSVVGYALLLNEPEWVYVRQFFICPEYRRQKLGSQAMRWLLEKMQGQTQQKMRIDVLINNAPGMAFWRSLGFQDYCLTMEREAAKPFAN